MIENLSSVSLVNYEDAHYEHLSYELDETQRRFTKTVYQNIKVEEVHKINNKYPITILYQENPVGFFLLDRTVDHLIVTGNPNSILLRGLSLNPNFQGKGIAKQALLLVDSFVKIIAEDIDEIVLTVNIENRYAYHLYLQMDYKDTGRFKNGRYGLQHMLFKRI
ncbi:GNAT family N-acetyltransferase [Sphingobacterium faecium]|uniref:GNAT family N-acetyltransferase n=1 Tax=Sphingobacterium faecium TaxID=34087 RepID=UPI0005F2A638|nr:GNAT family N-acetyltransferase [Sphingobacterium faecium]UXD69760.1 GNAT family N-acetyltransferase [Sphingobacterium faecium]